MAYSAEIALSPGKYLFDHWEINGVTFTENPISSLMPAYDVNVVAYYKEAPLPTHTLTVVSTPITGVPITVDGKNYTTPTAALPLEEGPHTVVVPPSVQAGSDVYNFEKWEDGTTNPTRTVDLKQDMTITCTYTLQPPPTYKLTVTSTPITGVPITVDETDYTTPTPPLTLPKGPHTVIVPSNVQVGADVYNFEKWEDGTTNPTRTVNLTADLTITCTYKLPIPEESFIEIHAFLDSQEIVVPYEIVGVQTGNTPATVKVNPGSYTVKATYDTETKTATATVEAGKTVRVDFQFVAVVQYSLEISVSAGGKTDPAPGTYDFDEGTTVQVKAIPNSGYKFTRWELDGVDAGVANPISVLMQADHTLKAVFTAVPVTAAGFAVLLLLGGLVMLIKKGGV